ncbi:MAG: sulfatase, partial [Verrucomicrobiae bacterium]|nr:sulfatase [Verrucomicrobiae bacterium]
MNPSDLSRRTFLNRATVGIGSLALTQQLMAETAGSANAASGSGPWTGAIQPHFAPKAKRVIFLCMA